MGLRIRMENLNYQVILDELESLTTVGNSRLLHKCSDASKMRVTVL